MIRLAGIAFALSIFVTACGGSSSSGGGAARTTPPASPSVASLDGLALTSAEATQAGIVPVSRRSVPNGDALEGTNSATLDLCGKTYPSDAMRVARHQVVYADVQHPRRVDESNELVRYRAGGAAQAYAEITAAAKNCPAQTTNGVHTSKVVVLARDPKLAPKQLTVTFVVTPPKGPRFCSAATYQYIGDLFTGFYVNRATRDQAVRAAEALGAASYIKVGGTDQA